MDRFQQRLANAYEQHLRQEEEARVECVSTVNSNSYDGASAYLSRPQEPDEPDCWYRARMAVCRRDPDQHAQGDSAASVSAVSCDSSMPSLATPPQSPLSVWDDDEWWWWGDGSNVGINNHLANRSGEDTDEDGDVHMASGDDELSSESDYIRVTTGDGRSTDGGEDYDSPDFSEVDDDVEGLGGPDGGAESGDDDDGFIVLPLDLSIPRGD